MFVSFREHCVRPSQLVRGRLLHAHKPLNVTRYKIDRTSPFGDNGSIEPPLESSSCGCRLQLLAGAKLLRQRQQLVEIVSPVFFRIALTQFQIDRVYGIPGRFLAVGAILGQRFRQ